MPLSGEMLEDINHDQSFIVINSDNCAAQYKCAAHFDKLQKLADKYQVIVIRSYGHGKGEVAHVGGLTKVCVRREVAAGRKLKNTETIVNFLEQKFGNKIDPNYTFKNISCEDLEDERRKNFANVPLLKDPLNFKCWFLHLARK